MWMWKIQHSVYTAEIIGQQSEKGFLLPEMKLPEELLFLQTVLEMCVQPFTISSSSLHLGSTNEMILSPQKN